MDGHNDQPDDFTIKGAATRGKKRQHAPDACTICLEPITERAVAAPCNHLTFDFLCLVSWLQEQSTCPLCKAKVTEVQYDWRSPDDYKSYKVPDHEEPQRKATSSSTARRRYALPRRRAPLSATAESSIDPSLARRRHIYAHRLYTLRVGANRISRYRDFTAQDFATSPDLQSRAKTFLRRELQVFAFLDTAPRGGNRDFLIEYIVAILRNNELRGAEGKAEELLKDFLGLENTRQLLHELEAWLRSPYTSLRDWDAHVQYADHGSGTMTAARGGGKEKETGQGA